jgi:mannose-6-phosphate isomerase-like protein (cupin superfamily)
VREGDQKSIPTGDRTFKLLINQETGASRVTQFIGVIPPGRAPMHHHTYEEAIYILEGEGRLWTEEGSVDFNAGASIYLPRGVSHCLENSGSANIRLLGVFHPSGSPAARYDD